MFTLTLTIYRFFRSMWRGLQDPEFRGILYSTLIILISGTSFYHGVEKWRWLDSFYFSVTTLTTVGLGDFAPQTDIGKIFTILYIFLGIGIILAFLNAVSKHARSVNPLERLITHNPVQSEKNKRVASAK